MSIMRNMAIKHKLISIIMLTCVFALLLAAATFIIYQWTSLRYTMVQDLSSHAEMIAENCKAAIAFEDIEDAEETLKSLHVKSNIVFGCIHTDDDRIFAIYYRDYADTSVQPSEIQEHGHNFEEGLLTVFKPVLLDGETIGTVCLRSDLQPIYAALKRSIGITLVALLIVSLLAYFVSSQLQRIISGPILDLAEVARSVSEEKDYSTRALRQSNDEVGLLINAFNKMLEQIQQRDSALVGATEQLEMRVRERTSELTKEVEEHRQAQEELERTHQKLMEASRKVGMAEVAAGVLHNVGNVLNSVNVSTTVIAEKVSNSKVSNLKKVADMLKDHVGDLGTFLTEDPQGKHMPEYLTKIAKLLIDEQADITEKLQSLAKNVEHIKEIINMQQSYAKASSIEVQTSLAEVVKNAIQINSASFDRHGVRLVYDFAELPDVNIDNQRLLQILVNLISNARYAVISAEQEHKVITVRIKKQSEERFQIQISDNGIGISEEKLTCIFQHGFTTRTEGHGFGLHSAALAVKEMGGELSVHSDGPGKGATFILELPFKIAEREMVKK